MENNEYYNYPIKNLLTKDYNSLNEIGEYSQITLCIYSVNTSGKYPFIQYLLSSNSFNMSLPNLPIFSNINREMLEGYSKVYLSGIFQYENFSEFNEGVDFDGFYEYDNGLYLFFDVTKLKLNVDDTSLLSPIRFALVEEILNGRKICNIQITSETTDFFTNNSLIVNLYNKNGEPYENPITGYVGKPTPEKTNFTYVFGESAKNKLATLGPYFYFTDFYHAVRQGGWSYNYKPEHINNKLITDNENGRYIKGGIIRFALFTGNTKFIENMPNDPNDESDIKKQRLNDKTLDLNYEIQTLRVSDHDGIWAKTYNSAYLGNIELDDGSFVKEAPIIVLKDYNQQIPLSYHFIDKSNLGDKYEPNNRSYRIV